MFAYLALFSILISFTSATMGVDVSQPVSKEAFQCLKSNGYQFAIVRVYREIGQVDTNGAQTIINARDAGIAYVDGYIYPCVSCGNPGQQVIDTVKYLREQSANFGMLWFDIEIGDWGTNVSANIQFILGLINQANIMSITWGIYTSQHSWNPITGSTADFGSPALWYAHYDNNPSFSDFVPFGGWKNPSIKQYVGDATECGVGIDKNFY